MPAFTFTHHSVVSSQKDLGNLPARNAGLPGARDVFHTNRQETRPGMKEAMSPPRTTGDAFEFVGNWSGQVIAASVHAGHDLRREIEEVMILDEEVRRREEDPFTELIAGLVPARVLTGRSRFEVDLNRPRDEAVYRRPEDCWDLQVWADPPLDDDLTARSLEVYDAFYAALGERLDPVAARGPFVLFDVHSYNHRRGGADGDPAPVEDNPGVNVGTGTLDDERFGGVVDALIDSLGTQGVGGGPLDARENVAFEGRAVAAWVHERYPDVGCALALEFKKTFMDENTGEPVHSAIRRSARALAAAIPDVLSELDALR